MAAPRSRYWIPVATAGLWLGVDPATVRGWAKRTLDGRPTRLRRARVYRGRYYVSRVECIALLARFLP